LVRSTEFSLGDLPEAPLVFGGKLPPGNGIDLLEQESYAAAVAELTAEGAVQTAMNHMDTAVNGSRFLIIGAGRIGMHLARKLHALGADVTVTARKDRDFSKIAMLGLSYDETGRYFNGLGGYDCICNTVPTTVLTPEQLAQTRKDCLFLELASAPYGFDGDVCRSLGRAYLLCAALPGKTAPKTAGEIIAKEVLSQLHSRP
jgi:dipicolinate synthase subunit A